MVVRVACWLVVSLVTGLATGDLAAQLASAPRASISGVVVDASSREPLTDAKVTLAGVKAPARSIDVDGLGRFSFSGIAPGVYTLEATAGYHHNGSLGSAEPDRRWFFELREGDERKAEVIALVRWAQISGRVVDDAGKPLAGVWVSALFPSYRSGMLFRSAGNQELTDADGRYHLDYVAGADRLVAYPQSSYPAFRSFELPFSRFRPTLFPGATDPDTAAPITLVPGADLRGVDIVMQRSAMSSVTVEFPERPGFPTDLEVWVRPPWCGLAGFCPVGEPRSTWRIDSWSGVSVSGTVTPPPEQSRANVCLAAIDEFDRYCATVKPDGTFTISSVPRDDYVVLVGSLRTQTARSVVVNGADKTDRPIHLTQNSEIAVTLTDRQTTVTGAVKGSPEVLLQSWVVAFPADPTMWTGFGPQPRRIRKARVIDGTFRMQGLPAGDYWLVPLSQDPADDYRWQFPEKFRSWLPRATRLFLAEGETATVDLRAVTER